MEDRKIARLVFEMANVYDQNEIIFDNSLGERILGQLVLNRIENIAYMNLKRNNKNLGVFDKTLELLCAERERESSYCEKAIIHVCEMLQNVDFEYALLKGAFLITSVYRKGFRQSNDIDILIEEKDIDKCQKLLISNGFIQGEVINGEFIKASRAEIIMSRMNYGETIPFCKKWEGKFITVDINFSLDYKPAIDAALIHDMLKRSVVRRIENTYLKTLDIADFIIHLSMHLYKEATTFDWVKRRKDLCLYKFSDINIMLREFVDEDVYRNLIMRIKEYGVEKECYYAMHYTAFIFNDILNDSRFLDFVDKIEPEDRAYLRNVIDPVENKIYTYDMDFEEWFSCYDRVSKLIEIKEGEGK